MDRDPFNDAHWPLLTERKRDADKRRCYKAEHAVLHCASNPRFRSLDEARLYLCSMFRSPTWDALGLPLAVPNLLRSSTRNSFAYGRSAGIPGDVHLARGQENLMILLHELAHSVVPVFHGHDARWRSAYVTLVAAFAPAALCAQLVRGFAVFDDC